MHNVAIAQNWQLGSLITLLPRLSSSSLLSPPLYCLNEIFSTSFIWGSSGLGNITITKSIPELTQILRDIHHLRCTRVSNNPPSRDSTIIGSSSSQATVVFDPEHHARHIIVLTKAITPRSADEFDKNGDSDNLLLKVRNSYSGPVSHTRSQVHPPPSFRINNN
ncbi:hypothetical protein F4775DRAFT_334761 [Biscogniauxia sp. FL1348]|nr:hypothetical protein F4775DRAFT_334761 [Biscogniauxia sp. FL1348]